MRHAARRLWSWLISDVGQMIHRTDERVFHYLEVACYVTAVVGMVAARVLYRQRSPYTMPMIFVILGSVAIVYMTRYLIYLRPHVLLHRERAASLKLSRDTKIALAFGYLMSTPMFVLGCIGLVSPAAMEKTITTLSPMKFILS